MTRAQERLRDAALAFFRDDAVPDELWWFDKLSPCHQRRFCLALSETL